MTDVATISWKADTTDLRSASAALDEFRASNSGAADAAQRAQSAMEPLTVSAKQFREAWAQAGGDINAITADMIDGSEAAGEMEGALSSVSAETVNTASNVLLMTQRVTGLASVMGGGSAGLTFRAAMLGRTLLRSLINPSTLIVAGFGLAAGAVAVFFQSFVGSGASTAADRLREHQNTIDRIFEGWESATDAISQYREAAARLPASVAIAQGQIEATQVTEQLDSTIESIIGTLSRLTGGMDEWGMQTDMSIVRLRNLIWQFQRGDIELNEFQIALAEIRMREDTSREVAKLIDELFAATQQAAMLRGEVDGVNSAIRQLSGVSISFGSIGSSEAIASLRDMIPELRSAREQASDIFSEAVGGARSANEIASVERAYRDLIDALDEKDRIEAAAKADQDAAAASRAAASAARAHADQVQAVIDALIFEQAQLGRSNTQQRIHNELRAAGIALDSEYGQVISELVTQIERETAAIEAEIEANQRRADAVNLVASSLGDLFFDLITDSEDAGEHLDRFLAQMQRALFNMILFGNVGGQLNSGAGIFGNLFGSLLQPRAEGGPVSAGKPYLVGERGAELFVPDGGGQIIPNGAGGGGKLSISLTIGIEQGELVPLAAEVAGEVAGQRIREMVPVMIDEIAPSSVAKRIDSRDRIFR